MDSGLIFQLVGRWGIQVSYDTLPILRLTFLPYQSKGMINPSFSKWAFHLL